jgi:Transglycosylase SLT domain
MSGAACEAARADLIRWSDTDRSAQASEVQAAVLRYDGQGGLIGAGRAEVSTAATPGDEPAARIRAPKKDLTAPADVLPAIRLVSRRYQHHPALKALDLTPGEWAAFFQAMIKVESNYRQGAVSRAGALGLAQLMPGTAADLAVDPADPIENLDGGARYLLDQMQRFGSLELALAAYNAGPAAVARHGGIPPYPETRSHVTRVMTAWGRILADL